MRRDYYAVLGVNASATSPEIRQAYRRLARQYSPDVNLWDRGAQALFDEIVEAYRVLSDSMARPLYDRYGHQAFQPDEPRGASRSRKAGGVRGDDLHYPLDLAFTDVARGRALVIEVSRFSPCPACGASGSRRGAPSVTCDRCGGTGSVWRDEGRARPEPCLACDGLGERVTDPCPACRGRGVSPALASLSVTIPAGVDTGALVRVPGEGHSGPFGGPRGDLVVITRIAPHPFFVRKGDNLHCDIPVALTEAVLGARIQVPTLEGSAALVLPPGSQSGQVFRLRGKGFPRLDGERRGDLYVTVKVLIPRGLDDRTQEIFRQLERLIPENPRVGLFSNSRVDAARAEGRQ